jgi:hypothetical protein
MDDTWYYIDDKDDKGGVTPISRKELNEKLAKEKNLDMLVWCASFPNWVRAGDVPRLRALLPPAAPLKGDINREAWYYADDTDKIGPIYLEQLNRELAVYQNPKDVLVWCEGSPKKWVRAEDVPELGPLIAALPPPLPLNWKRGWFRVGIVASLCLAATVGWLAYVPLRSVLSKYLAQAFGSIVGGLLLWFVVYWVSAGFKRHQS